jgi:phage tail tube protein FII
MPATIYTMESVNMICGDTGDAAAPGISTHLEIIELKLPMLERNYVDHTPGGAPVQIEVPMYINRLESTFTLAGWNPAVMSMIAQEARALKRFTAYGLIRDRRTNNGMQALSIFEAQLGRVNPTNFTKGGLQNMEYSLRSIVHYELYMQETIGVEPTEIYFWDFFTSTFRVGDVNLNAELNQLLAIPGVAI